MQDSGTMGGWGQSVVDIFATAQHQGWSEQDLARLWHTHDFLAVAFAGRHRGSGRPFLNHLAGTAVLMQGYTQDPDIILAAYAHAVYDHGEFGRLKKGATPQNRAELRAIIGTQAEELVSFYGPFGWSSFAESKTASDVLALSENDKAVLLIQIVNELEDTLDAPAYDQRWRDTAISRLQASIGFAQALDQPALAERIAHRLLTLTNLAPTADRFIRRKRSRTLVNRSLLRNRLLGKARRAMRVLQPRH